MDLERVNRNRFGRPIAVAVFVASSACTVVTALTDLDSEGVRGQTTTDGGVDGTAPGLIDSGCIGAACADARGGRFCPPGRSGKDVFFCSDFEEPSLGDGWEEKTGPGLSLSDDGGRSRWLVAALPPVPTHTAGSFLRKTIEGSWSKLLCTFLYQRDVVGEAYPVIFQADVETTGGKWGAGIHAGSGDGPVEVGFPPDAGAERSIFEVPFGFARGVQRRIGIELTRQRVTALLDGAELGFTAHPANFEPLRTHISLGAFDSGTSALPWQFRFDDLECIATP